MFEKEIKEALKAANLDESLYTLVSIDKIEDIEGAVATLKDVITPVLQKIGDQRATSATQTAISNYEKKHNILDGKLKTELPKTELPKTENNSELSELKELVLALNQKMESQDKEKEYNVKKQSVMQKLQTAGIPEPFQKMFKFDANVEDAQIETEINEFKQNLISLNVAGMKEPGSGQGVNISVDRSKRIAENRNANRTETGGNVPGKKIV